MTLLAACPGGNILEPAVAEQLLIPTLSPSLTICRRPLWSTERGLQRSLTLQDALLRASLRQNPSVPCSADRLGSNEVRHPELVHRTDV